MEKETTHKIQDFIFNIMRTNIGSSFQINAIIAEHEQINNVAKAIALTGLQIEVFLGRHEDESIKSIIENFELGKGIVLSVIDELPSKVASLLDNAYETNAIYVQLAGQEKPLEINPINKDAFVILLMNNETYSRFEQKKLISSVLRV